MAEKGNLLGLDLMRAVAALCVVLVHSHLLFGVNLAPGAHLAVDFFFALSGFVIAHAYDHTAMGMREFMLKRAIRLYPLYFAGLLLGVSQALALLMLGRTSMTGSDIALSATLGLFYLPSPFGGASEALFPLNGPAWSLFFELIVNAMYASVLFRRQLVMGVLLAVSAIALVAATLDNANADIGWQWNYMHFGLAKVVYSFTAGVVLRRYLKPCPWVARGPAVWCVMGSLTFLLVCPVPQNLRTWWDLAFLLCLSPMLVWIGASALLEQRTGQMAKTLGNASYGLYITHLPLMFAAGFVGHKAGLPAWLLGPGFVLAMLALAIWLERVWDRPARAWLLALALPYGNRKLAPIGQA